MKLRAVIVLLLLAGIAAVPSFSQQRSIHRVPQDYRTLQSAIDAAHLHDTVIADHGVYYENVSIGRNIVLGSRFILDRDTSHISRTVIDGSRPKDPFRASVIKVYGATDTSCLITGLTIQNGRGTYIIFDNDPEDKHWIVGGGILVFNTGARIARNIIRQNIISPVGKVQHASGGGIAAVDTLYGKGPLLTPLIIEDNIVTHNSSSGYLSYAGGILLEQPAHIVRNVISHNTTFSRTRAVGGGMVTFVRADYTIVIGENVIVGNSSSVGGGLVVASPEGFHLIRNNVIAENRASEAAGGINISERTRSILWNNTIVNNISSAYGGGINAPAGAIAALANNIVWGNSAGQIRATSHLRAVHNLVQGGFPGARTLDVDPLFVPGDSLYRLSEASPARGFGATSVRIADSLHHVPETDLWGNTRRTDHHIDLGAHQHTAPSDGGPIEISELHEHPSDYIALSISIQEVSPTEYDSSGTRVTRGGRMQAAVWVNDSLFSSLGQEWKFDPISLPPGSNTLSVDVTAHAIDSVSHLYGSIILEGYDQFNELLSRSRPNQTKLYQNLPPGAYRLAVRVADNVGFIDGRNSFFIDIVVHEFWWNTWWFRVLIVLAIIGLVTYVYVREVQRARHKQFMQHRFSRLQLESQEAERKRLAAELHDGLGQNLLLASNELQQHMMNEKVLTEELRQAGKLLEESIRDVRLLSSNLHPHQLDSLGFCAAVLSLIETVSHASGLTINARCSQSTGILSKEAETHLYRIIQEALSNVVRHAEATHVLVEVRMNNGYVHVEISDDGKGLDKKDEHALASMPNNGERRGFGLPNMQERARILGSRLHVGRRTPRGTRITLNVPVR